ncbi:MULTISPECIES: helix-turn-helix domain-containing protein [Caballeronia]|uniref:helix-turn-helix domain-containing protein n=1 Tax=Caballeronia TaxID=1827195 RepID=UPI000A7578A6|nr:MULTISPECIES: helix-turn-helix domain-containing protein [Caballeronia]MCG7403647.1 helix-turn-helix domain-containing protein [Caballeronia zhejiangensis]MCI1045556.1 helix-turn-helix domain-containing protein [Caballeronia zhejiangensis]MDR5765401.1 helix-turn-helix domain-containing protein [Caballeronia sp. LZ028]
MFLNKCVYRVELKINSLYRETAPIDRSYVFDSKLYLFSNGTDGYSYRSISLDCSAPRKLRKEFRVVEASPGGGVRGRVDFKRKFQALALLHDGAPVVEVSREVNLSVTTAYRYRRELHGLVALRPQNTNSLLRMLAFRGDEAR